MIDKTLVIHPAILSARELTPTEIHLLAKIHSLIQDGICKASYNTLADMLFITKSNAIRAANGLSKKGYIGDVAYSFKGHARVGFGLTGKTETMINDYIEASSKGSQFETSSDSNGSQSDQKGSQSETCRGSQSETCRGSNLRPPSERTPKEDSQRRLKSALPSAESLAAPASASASAQEKKQAVNPYAPASTSASLSVVDPASTSDLSQPKLPTAEPLLDYYTAVAPDICIPNDYPMALAVTGNVDNICDAELDSRHGHSDRYTYDYQTGIRIPGYSRVHPDYSWRSGKVKPVGMPSDIAAALTAATISPNAFASPQPSRKASTIDTFDYPGEPTGVPPLPAEDLVGIGILSKIKAAVSTPAVAQPMESHE